MNPSKFERISSKVFVVLSGANCACAINSILNLQTEVSYNLASASINILVSIICWRLSKESEGRAIILDMLEKEYNKLKEKADGKR